jgi:hypothetical protein
MTDVFCRVCGEPWDVHHIRHDAPAWVAPLFFAGAGCESCEGNAPQGVNAEKVAELSDRNLVIDSPDDRDPLALRPAIAGDSPPPWKRPTDPLVWECEGGSTPCKVRVYRDLDWEEGSDYAFQVRTGDLPYRSQMDLGIHRDDQFPTLESALEKISLNGTHCLLCAYKCRDCSRVLIEGEDFSAAPPDDPYTCNASLCEECFSSAEYELACESYSQTDLLSALGYQRNSHVYRWFDAQMSTVELSDAMDLGVAEVAGDQIVYMVPNRYAHLIDTPENRRQRARILWTMREIVRDAPP